MQKELVVCWDMDETLGYFWRMMYEIEGQAPPWELKPTGLRPNVVEVLSEIKESGGINVLTTRGHREYAEEVIKRAGLSIFFDLAFYGSEIYPGLSKSYEPVIRKLGMTRPEALRRMLVIGDSFKDQPLDTPGLVFLHQPEGYQFDAVSLYRLITRLQNEGRGNFNKGFNQLYSNSFEQDLGESGRYSRFEYRPLPLPMTSTETTPTAYISMPKRLRLPIIPLAA